MSLVHWQGVLWVLDIIVRDDSLGLCDQKSSYKHVSNVEHLQSYDHMKLRREGKDYRQDMK